MKRRILIVENEIRVYEWLANCLGEDMFEMVWSRSTHESRCRSLEEPFDLVLLDLDLAGMDGWKALDWFNKMHPFLPVIVLTDNADQSQRAMAIGVDACLQKPLDGPLLLEGVNQLLLEAHSARMARLTAPVFDREPVPN